MRHQRDPMIELAVGDKWGGAGHNSIPIRVTKVDHDNRRAQFRADGGWNLRKLKLDTTVTITRHYDGGRVDLEATISSRSHTTVTLTDFAYPSDVTTDQENA